MIDRNEIVDSRTERTFLCLALSSLETLAFSFMVTPMRWSIDRSGDRERGRRWRLSM